MRPWRALLGSGESPTTYEVEWSVVQQFPSAWTIHVGYSDGSERRFWGDCTVWHEEPAGLRPGTLMEGWLYTRWALARRERGNG